MSKIKVIEYIPEMYDGGAETLVKDYAIMLNKDKFEPRIVVTECSKSSANLVRLRERNIPVIPIYPQWNLLVRIWNKLFGRFYVPYRLKRILRKEDAQVLHVHMLLLDKIRAISNALKNVRLFYTCHSLPQRYFCGSNAREREAASYLLSHCGLRLIALHDDMARELNEMFDINHTLVIRNGVDFNSFRSVSVTKEKKREQLEIPKTAFLIGHVGRFDDAKNQLYLVDVFREVKLRKKEAYLLMVGAQDTSKVEGKLKAYGLEDSYQILRNRTDINELMHAMDVFVFPSKYEGLGIALIEAQTAGLRCIASDAVPNDAFRTEKAVALPLGNPGQWADVILDESFRGKAYGPLEDYDMNREIKLLEKLYSGEII